MPPCPGGQDCACRPCPAQKRVENRANPADLLLLLFAGLCCMDCSILGGSGTVTNCVSGRLGGMSRLVTLRARPDCLCLQPLNARRWQRPLRCLFQYLLKG